MLSLSAVVNLTARVSVNFVSGKTVQGRRTRREAAGNGVHSKF